VALVLTFTVAVVLVAVVSNLILAARLSVADRAAALAALGAIGVALAVALGRWLADVSVVRRRRRRWLADDDDETDV
jgi:hypothetical protein